MTLPELKLPDTSVCPRCGAGLRCGMVAGDAQCWCVQLPQVMPVPRAKSPHPNPPPEGEGTKSPRANAAEHDEFALREVPAGKQSNPAAACFCPACLQQITDERLNAC